MGRAEVQLTKRYVLAAICLTAVVLPACGKHLTADQKLIEKARAIVTDVTEARWEDARADFDETMLKALPSSKLGASWASYVRAFGDFRSQGDAEVIKRGRYRVVNIALVMAQRRGQARVAFDSNGQVAGLFFLRTGVPVP